MYVTDDYFCFSTALKNVVKPYINYLDNFFNSTDNKLLKISNYRIKWLITTLLHTLLNFSLQFFIPTFGIILLTFLC